jgi:alpha-mannosidase
LHDGDHPCVGLQVFSAGDHGGGSSRDHAQERRGAVDPAGKVQQHRGGQAEQHGHHRDSDQRENRSGRLVQGHRAQ